MLIQMLAQQPQMLGPVLRATPAWVWGLAAGLVWLALGQARARSVPARRLAFMPLGMALFSLWGLAAAFGAAAGFVAAIGLWLGCAALALLATAALGPPPGARYDAASGRFHLPGSLAPALLIAGLFLLKYGVGVETAMQPALAADSGYALGVAALYGLASGLFAGRAARLWPLAGGPRLGWRQRDAW